MTNIFLFLSFHRATLSAQPTPLNTVAACHFHVASLASTARLPNTRNSLKRNCLAQSKEAGTLAGPKGWSSLAMVVLVFGQHFLESDSLQTYAMDCESLTDCRLNGAVLLICFLAADFFRDGLITLTGLEGL